MAATRPGPGYRGFAERVLTAHRIDMLASQEQHHPTCRCGAPAELCGVRAAAREYGVPLSDPELIDPRRFTRGGTA